MARRENDFYPTPAQLTKELLKRVEISGTVFECCAGDGAIVKELNATHLLSLERCVITEIITNDIDRKQNADYCLDISNEDNCNWKSFFSYWAIDWVVTNPPFTKAADIIPLAWDNALNGVAMLLRLSYLEPAKNRGAWLQEHSQYLTDLIIFGQPRPSFTNNGKVDTATTAWFVWQKEPKQSGTQLHFVTDWKVK